MDRFRRPPGIGIILITKMATSYCYKTDIVRMNMVDIDTGLNGRGYFVEPSGVHVQETPFSRMVLWILTLPLKTGWPRRHPFDVLTKRPPARSDHSVLAHPPDG